jgi:hypothetical protein
VVKPGGPRGPFYPTEIGMVVCDLLVKNFPYIFDTAYTAKLELELDDIEEGKEKWTDLLKGFYGHFEEELKVAEKEMESIKAMEIVHRREVRAVRFSAGVEVGQVRDVLLVQRLQQEGQEQLYVYQGKPCGQAGYEYSGGAGGGAERRVLRQLRAGDGAEARAVWAVHVVPWVQ